MNKVVSSPAEAVADIVDGATIGIAGFGVAHRFPSSLIAALRDKGATGLTVYCNGLGQPGHPTAHLLADSGQIAHLVTCFSARPGVVSEAERAIQSGRMTLEMVPQGTLVERMRAGGAGLAAIYTPVAVGTSIAEGKDTRYFDGRPYVLERAIATDFALIRAHRADQMGNLRFRGGSRNFNVSFAKAARLAIAEVDEIVEVGELGPDEVDLPGVFVARVVASVLQMDVKNLPMRPSRPADNAREYLGKPALTRAEVAHRTARLLPDGAVVNLGAGLPNLVSNYIGDRAVILHSENGILNYGAISPSKRNPHDRPAPYPFGHQHEDDAAIPRRHPRHRRHPHLRARLRPTRPRLAHRRTAHRLLRLRPTRHGRVRRRPTPPRHRDLGWRHLQSPGRTQTPGDHPTIGSPARRHPDAHLHRPRRRLRSRDSWPAAWPAPTSRSPPTSSG